jgi:hypothetical protein
MIEREDFDSNCQVQHLFISSHLVNEDFAPEPLVELVEGPIEKVELGDYTRRLGSTAHNDEHPDVTKSLISSMGTSYSGFYTCVESILERISTQLETLNIVTYYPHVGTLALRWGTLPKLKILRLYLKGDMRQSVILILSAPVLSVVTFGMPGNNLFMHWSRFISHIKADRRSVHTLVLEGLLLSQTGCEVLRVQNWLAALGISRVIFSGLLGWDYVDEIAIHLQKGFA